MKELVFEKMNNALRHLEVLHNIFMTKENFTIEEEADYNIYKQNEGELRKVLDSLSFNRQIYGEKGRQMILADLFEYIFLGRGYYSMQSQSDKKNFIKAVLYFVNLLMCYEVMTVSNNLRRRFLEKLGEVIPEIIREKHYDDLKDFIGTVGLTKKRIKCPANFKQIF